MGGKATKHFKTAKLSAEQHCFFAKKIIQSLPAEIAFAVPRSYHTKMYFRDLDLIGEMPTEKFIQTLKRVNGITVIGVMKNNAELTSIALKMADETNAMICFQLDYIQSPANLVQYRADFYSFNDLSFLVSKNAGAIHLTMTLNGLFKRVYFDIKTRKLTKPKTSSSVVYLDILLSTNYLDILHLCCLSSKKFKRGFESLEDIAQYFMKCRFWGEYTYNGIINSNNLSAKQRPLIKTMLRMFEENPALLNFKYNQKQCQSFNCLKTNDTVRDFHLVDKINKARKFLKTKYQWNDRLSVTKLCRRLKYFGYDVNMEKCGQVIKLLKQDPQFYNAKVMNMPRREFNDLLLNMSKLHLNSYLKTSG